MPFSENTKLEAKRRSHFTCVICHQPFVEVHHILPQAAGGSDDLDNAAPLCAYCHDLVGANPEKRKQIREMRNLWWEICEKRPANPNLIDLNKRLDTIQDQLSKNAARTASGMKFRGEYDPRAQYDVDEVVFITAGSSAGAFLCIQKPPIGTPPYFGGGYFVEFPFNPNGGRWM